MLASVSMFQVLSPYTSVLSRGTALNRCPIPLRQQRLPHFPRVFLGRQHFYKVEGKVNSGSRALACDDCTLPHYTLFFYALRARDFEPRITRRRRPFHDTRDAEHVRRCTNRGDVFAGFVCCAYEPKNALIAFEVDVTWVPSRKDKGFARLDVVDRDVRH